MTNSTLSNFNSKGSSKVLPLLLAMRYDQAVAARLSRLNVRILTPTYKTDETTHPTKAASRVPVPRIPNQDRKNGGA
ncbi:hypothetical protein ACQU0X_32675 [Pseudovibrio ascidiaceicola]|uniref:hypothetical protein n=1 Tax=Pseudovibrio ascidiaceicola TaxID=285279 RepID=UPI003D364B6F